MEPTPTILSKNQMLFNKLISLEKFFNLNIPYPNPLNCFAFFFSLYSNSPNHIEAN